MRSTISSCVIFLFLCSFGLRTGIAQDNRPSDHSSVQTAVANVEPHALAVLQQMEATYIAMQSFSVELEEETINHQRKFSLRDCADLAFRRPDHLVFTALKSGEHVLEPNKVMTDGKHAYVTLDSTPNAYSEVPDVVGAATPFDVTARIPHLRGVDWIEHLLEGKGIEGDYLGWKLRSLSSKRAIFKQRTSGNGIPVEAVSAQWVDTNGSSTYEQTCQYMIGSRDHLLYQATSQGSDQPFSRSARFLYSQSNPILPDTVFAIPPGAAVLPNIHVATSWDDNITLDKGSLDGIAVGDRLVVYVDAKMRIQIGSIRVMKTEPHTCEAEIESSSVGIGTGRPCLVIERKADTNDVRQNPDNNSLRWPTGATSRAAAGQTSPTSMDLHVITLLQLLGATYQTMQSFATEFETGEMDKRGHVSFSRHGQFAFRGPEHLAFAIGSTDARFSEPTRVIFDGEHAYTVLSRSPFRYIPVPSYYPTRPISLLARAGGDSIGRLYGLLVGKGLEPDQDGLELKSLTSKLEKFVEGTRVEIVKARWVSTEHDSKNWEIDTYTIGERDHLLYQTSRQSSTFSASVTRYFHPQANVILPDGLFTLPPGAALLPEAHVTDLETDSVTLDKGSLDGLAINDVLAVFRVSGESKTQVGEVFVAKIEAHTCLAPILENSGGLRPGDLCIVVDHQDSYTRAKTDHNKNAWLWPRVSR